MRRGKKKALVAVGHQIIIAAYYIIKNQEPYQKPSLHNNPKKKARKVKSFLEKLKELGVEVKIKQMVQKTEVFLLPGIRNKWNSVYEIDIKEDKFSTLLQARSKALLRVKYEHENLHS